ncbi:MAG: PD40 domain-containing protein [Phycisphaerales bacterium]|nr:PD40 domain-containing protein [Phycisphaerales bacterium]
MPASPRPSPSLAPRHVSAAFLMAVAAGSASLQMACASDASVLPQATMVSTLPASDESATTTTAAAAWMASQSRVGYPRMPSLSPDGSMLVFTWAGDLWAVDSEGGIASQLTTHPADDLRSAFSPDGSTLVFESTRDGSRNLYAMPLAMENGRVVAGAVRRLTLSDRSLSLSGFHPDGEHVLVHGRLQPSMYRGVNMYTVPMEGGAITPLTDAYGSMPRMAADGSRVLFTRQRDIADRPAYQGPAAGDLWQMDTETGRFTQLTMFDGNDAHGFALPDGSTIYVSSRHGQNNVWRIPAGRTDADGPSALTNFKPAEGELSIGHGVMDLNVSFDGSTATFLVWDTLYTLDLTGRDAQPQPVEIYASGDMQMLDTRIETLSRQVSEAVLSPDGKTLAVVARGEVFVRSTDDDRPTRRVTFTSGREQDIAWSPDNQYLYFASDETGEFAIYRASVSLAREDIKPEEPEEEETVEEETEDATEESTEETTEEATEGTEETTEEVVDDTEGDAETADEEATEDEEAEEEEKIDHGKRWAESLRFDVEPLVMTDVREVSPMPAPDGRSLLFMRERGDLWHHDFATGEQRLVFESWNTPGVQWASDSRHIVYNVADLDFNSDVWLLDLGDEDAEPINLTRHPDIDTSPRLSADGSMLVFLSDRAGNNWSYDVYGILLDRSLEGLTDYELEQHFVAAAKAVNKKGAIDTPNFDEEYEAPEPLEFDAEDAWQRVRRLTRVDGAGNLALTPGGDRVLYSTSIDGSTSLFSVNYRGQDRKTVQSGGVSSVYVTPNGSKAVFIRSGQASTARPGGGGSETLGIDARVRIDVAAEQAQKFRDAANMLGREFYHPTMKGLDWSGLTERYLELARVTRTPSEFYQVGRLLMGELNGSHLGIWGGTQMYSPPSIRTGYLGVDAMPVDGGYEVTYVLPEGPAWREASRLEVGDVITAINGNALSADGGMPMMDLGEAMAGTTGEETLLDIIPADPDRSQFVLIVPTSSGGDSNLRYEDGVRQRRAMVDQMSDGRVGYLHIRGMNEPSLRDFERDLFAAANGKDGLLIDVRDNGGGWTTDILLSSLTAPRHAYTIPRGANADDVPADAYPRDRRLIYGYTRPIAVLCNENSYSNAEIFSHAIKTTGRGTLVGQQTYGAVISTGSYRLIDGTTVRRPFRGWFLPDGTDMENNGAMPDVVVLKKPQHEVEGVDPQLEAGVRAVMEDLD